MTEAHPTCQELHYHEPVEMLPLEARLPFYKITFEAYQLGFNKISLYPPLFVIMAMQALRRDHLKARFPQTTPTSNWFTMELCRDKEVLDTLFDPTEPAKEEDYRAVFEKVHLDLMDDIKSIQWMYSVGEFTPETYAQVQERARKMAGFRLMERQFN